MKAADIQKLKEMSSLLTSTLPDTVMVDSNGNFYYGGEQKSPMDLLVMLNKAVNCVQELDEVIQGIESRKSPKKGE